MNTSSAPWSALLRCLCLVMGGMFIITGAWGQSSARQIDRPEMAISLTPGLDFESGGLGHPWVIEFPAFTMIYQNIVFAAVPSFGFGKAQAPFSYNAKLLIPEGGKFTQERLALRLGYAFQQEAGMIIPYFGFSGMRISHKTSAGERKSIQLLPNYTIGVNGIFDLASRFHMTTFINDRLILRHFVHLRLDYTFVDPSTTGQRKTNLPNGIFGLGVGWGAFFGPGRY